MATTIDDDLRRELTDHPFWYHTIDLPDGLTTKGLFDLRKIVDRLPWPDVRGKRCLDVGTFDGFFAFELERRGAREVVAVDVPDASHYDWPADVRPGLSSSSAADRPFYDRQNNAGFTLAAKALQSDVEWRASSIYDLDAATLGTFDVVVCSSLLLHLRDPIRALEAVRSVCGGQFMSFEPIDVWLTMLHRRMAVARFDGKGTDCQWWTPNGVGHARMLSAAGFGVEKVSRPLMVEFNFHTRPKRSIRRAVHSLVDRAATGTSRPGVIQRAALCHPSL